MHVKCRYSAKKKKKKNVCVTWRWWPDIKQTSPMKTRSGNPGQTVQIWQTNHKKQNAMIIVTILVIMQIK